MSHFALAGFYSLEIDTIYGQGVGGCYRDVGFQTHMLRHMVIKVFNHTYLKEMAKLFVQEYSEPDRIWDLTTALKYLDRNVASFPDYCRVMVSTQDEFVGGICCRIDPYYSGMWLFIDTLQVIQKFRKQAVAKALMNYVISLAKKENLQGIHFLGDSRKGFPAEWYKGMGFVSTGWLEYEVTLEKLDLSF